MKGQGGMTWQIKLLETFVPLGRYKATRLIDCPKQHMYTKQAISTKHPRCSVLQLYNYTSTWPPQVNSTSLANCVGKKSRICNDKNGIPNSLPK